MAAGSARIALFVAGTAGARMGMRAVRRATEGAPGNVGDRPLHGDADTQPARPWRDCAGRCFRMAEVARRGARIVRRRASRLERVSLAPPLARFAAKGINLGVEVI